MEYTIAEIVKNRKVQDVLLISVVVLLGVISFGLGRLSAITYRDSGVALCTLQEQPMAVTASVFSAGEVGAPGTETATNAPAVGEGAYVASKNGTAYHFPWCSGALRIKEENKVWFQTKEEAEQAGYRAASNCKGL